MLAPDGQDITNEETAVCQNCLWRDEGRGACDRGAGHAARTGHGVETNHRVVRPRAVDLPTLRNATAMQTPDQQFADWITPLQPKLRPGHTTARAE